MDKKGKPWWPRKTIDWKHCEDALHAGSTVSLWSHSVFAQKAPASTWSFSRTKPSPAPLDKHLALLPVSGRPPVCRHGAHNRTRLRRSTVAAVLRPFSAATSSRAPGGVGGWLTTPLELPLSSCSQFSGFRKIFAPWQRNAITPSYNRFP